MTKMNFQASLALLAAVVCFVSVHAAAKQPKSSAEGDRNKRGLYASPYAVAAPYPYAASPYVASPYVASPYAAPPYVVSPYAATSYASSRLVSSAPYVAPYHPYGAVSSYATYPYVAKTYASPYAYYP